MPNQLDNVQFNGNKVSVIFPFSFTLPSTVRMNKTSDHELTVEVDYTVKMFGLFSVTRTGSAYYNFDTGTVKFKP